MNTAKVDKILVYYDGPQVLRLLDGERFIIAVANAEGDYPVNFLGASVPPDVYEKFRDNGIDMRTLMLHSDATWWKFQYLGLGERDEVALNPIERDNLDDIPDEGLFARDCDI